ncbi:hypothetical protein [Pseudomonas muyukensis]|uniref:Nucleoid-associated protein n=1 Tax=Pseudomonas muyukensis TaxID=2842357 RepID=A0ABX8MEJ8_9PSED|nr:hypothetical protein [Pseudomonas muyukensis]QXH37506.1 hypothetical protein KSS95_12040 [Pseudomonas muyukensis]
MTTDAQAPEVTLFEEIKNILFSRYADEGERQHHYKKIRSITPYPHPGHVLKAELEKDGSFLTSSPISEIISHFLSYYRAAVFPYLSLENHGTTESTYNLEEIYYPEPIYSHEHFYGREQFDSDDSKDTNTPLKYPPSFVKFSASADDSLMLLLAYPSHTQTSALKNFFDQCSKAEAQESKVDFASLLPLPTPLKQFLKNYVYAKFGGLDRHTDWNAQASSATKVTPQSLVESLEQHLAYQELKDYSPAGDYRSEAPYNLANEIYNSLLKELADSELENKAEDVELKQTRTTHTENYKVTVTLKKIKFEPGLKQQSFAEVRNGITQNANFYNKDVVCNGTIALEVSVRRQRA